VQSHKSRATIIIIVVLLDFEQTLAGCILTCRPSCASLVAIRPFVL